ncbi:MAG: hypothetical protein GEU94_18475, partial [Micromonosporaceae bacterium]|nr:hypothetical protein [Micromonosporaceae bacterium]
MIQAIDHVALLPAYLAAGTAVLVLVCDLFLAPGSATRRGVLLSVAALGVIAAGVAAVAVGVGGVRTAFCVPGGELPGGV